MNTAVIYCRVSTDKQMYQGISLETQKKMCEQFCLSKDLQVVKVLEEAASSESISLQHCLQQVADIKPRFLVVYNVSRFSRNVVEGLDYARKLRKLGTELLSATEILDTSTPSGEHYLTTLLNAAEFERKMIQKRINDTIKYKKSTGFAYGPVPYGKKVVWKDKIRGFELNPSERAAQLFIVSCRATGTKISSLNELIAQCGYSGQQSISLQSGDQLLCAPLDFANIAKILNDCGVTKRGRSWTASSVRGSLKRFYKS
jgi:DNA invertase Pin-like site-specific DNA recombinase